MTILEKKFFMVLLTVVLVSTAIYVLPSGLPQPGHVLMIFLAIFSVRSAKSIEIGKPELLLLLYWLYTTSINIFYWFLYEDPGFLAASAHITYGVLLFFIFRQLFLSNPRLSGSLVWALLFVILVLMILAFSGNEQFYFKGRRLMGSFNDPNQMSYWLLLLFCGALLATHKPVWFKQSTALVIFAIIFLLFFMAGSRSALIASFVLFGALLAWCAAGSDEKYRSETGLIRLLGLGLCLLVLLLTCLFLLYQFVEPIQDAVYDLWRRIGGRSAMSHLEMRGYLRIFDWPENIIFGAGHGFEGRFSKQLHEIHSSLIGPLFYYGIIGFSLFYGFVYSLARQRLHGWQWLVYATPFVYGLFTYGLRTPVFWVMLAVLYSVPPRVSHKH